MWALRPSAETTGFWLPGIVSVRILPPWAPTVLQAPEGGRARHSLDGWLRAAPRHLPRWSIYAGSGCACTALSVKLDGDWGGSPRISTPCCFFSIVSYTAWVVFLHRKALADSVLVWPFLPSLVPGWHSAFHTMDFHSRRFSSESGPNPSLGRWESQAFLCS